MDGVEGRALALRALDERTTHAAGRVSAAAHAVADSWSGRAADAWTVGAQAEGARAQQTAATVGRAALALMAYAQAVRDLARRASITEAALHEAETARRESSARRGALVRSDHAEAWQLRLASAEVATSDHDVSAAQAALRRFAEERASIDALLVSQLRGLVPDGWQHFQVLAGSLAPVALVGGSGWPGALRRWIARLPDDDVGADALRWALSHLTDEQFSALLAAAPEVAPLLMRRSDLAHDPRFAAVAAAASGAGGLDAVAAVSAAFAVMSAADRAQLARLHPCFVGNLDGAPFADRILANRTAITSALETERGRERALLDRLRELARSVPDISDPQTWGGYVDPAAHQELALGALRLAQIRALKDRYHGLLTGTTRADGSDLPTRGHQVLLFDPAGGRFAELIGTLGPATTSIGVLVGGTGTTVASMAEQRARAAGFVAKGRGAVAMITYLGGPMPQQVAFDAVSTAYATAIAPRLRDFVAGIDRPAGATVTVLGHSYGGAVVGAAEAAGMVVDRVVHVESAGAGPRVAAVHDYAAPHTPRYSMTAPGDPIALVQGVPGGGNVHGADPDRLAGVVQLETGRVDHEDPTSALVAGWSSHDGVFAPGTTAWHNLYSVVAGDEPLVRRTDRAGP